MAKNVLNKMQSEQLCTWYKERLYGVRHHTYLSLAEVLDLLPISLRVPNVDADPKMRITRQGGKSWSISYCGIPFGSGSNLIDVAYVTLQAVHEQFKENAEWR